MVKVLVVVREPGRLKPEYSLPFDLPAVPTIGSYISIQRPDKREPFGEDMIVRQVWWRLKHPQTGGASFGEPLAGSVSEIVVECEPALGPYSSDAWRSVLEGARKGRGAEIPEFEAARFVISEAELDALESPTKNPAG